MRSSKLSKPSRKGAENTEIRDILLASLIIKQRLARNPKTVALRTCRRYGSGKPKVQVMSQTVAIVTPAYQAQSTLATTVRSVLDQTHADWQHWIVADDGFDYAPFLAERGLNDPRQVFLTSGGTGRGASVTRNVALERFDTRYAAILDADDRMKPQKLEKAIAALADFGIVTTALDVMTED